MFDFIDLIVFSCVYVLFRVQKSGNGQRNRKDVGWSNGLTVRSPFSGGSIQSSRH